MNETSQFIYNLPTRQLHRPSSIAGLSFLGHAEEGQNIVFLWLKVLSERCIARQPMGRQPSRPRTQSQSLAGPLCCLPVSLPVGVEGNRKSGPAECATVCGAMT